MSEVSIKGEDFIVKAEALVLENISNEQFGVSELAEALNMSRSNLLRKIKKHTQLSASQFIREVRLKKGLDLLKEGSLTVSEISYQVGFGSTSYFIKCFREYYGHPPGEIGKIEEKEKTDESTTSSRFPWKIVAAAAVAVLSVLLWFFSREDTNESILEKSIAVLPFKNESNDSTNLYFVNGLMESTLTNLQKIEDLRVISRTSTERYRETSKTIPQISEELNVNYIVEGSGQKVGDRVLLNIQLIEASSDRHIWAQQYSREVVDIFALQNEVAKEIAGAIEAIVTPAELEQIEKRPTENIQAYDYYLQARDPYFSRTREGLEVAIPLFKKAIEHDPQFALAYADMAIAYFFLDVYQEEKQYIELVNNYADKALLYDSKMPESLIAKALYYMLIEEYRLALPHLEKALEYNPNSAAVVQILADYYARIVPNTAKYLEYALKGIRLDIASNDSLTNSYTYLHMSNAFVQNGFVEEAVKYINLSLDYDSNNYFAPHLKSFVLYARDRDIVKTQKMLLREWQKDTTRLDILQDLAKVYYFNERYDSAFFYFEKFVNARDMFGLDIYPQEDAKIAYVYEKMGMNDKAKQLFSDYKDYCENDVSIYKSASLAVQYVHEGDYDEAIAQLRIFATQENFQYWILLFMSEDPIMRPLQAHPEFEGVMQEIENRFWEDHDKLRKMLEEEGLLQS